VGDHSEARENKNVNFWVTEESEEVLIENRISSACGVKESGVQVSVSKKHCNSSGKNWE